MNVDHIPSKLDFSKEAKNQRKLKFSIQGSRLPRLVNLLPQVDSNIQATLMFGMDEDKKMFLDLQVEANLLLECQRCLEPLPFELVSEHRLVPEGGNDQEPMEGVEPLVLDENGNIDVIEILEDELLLALPMCPMHETLKCHSEKKDLQDLPETHKPFSGLAELLNKLN